MIEVRSVSKSYGRHLAVEELTFSINQGEVVGFLGPNGAGKSTTMNMITGCLLPSEGSILVDGISVTEKPKEAKAKIGYLPEMPPLYSDMTVTEYLSFVYDLKKAHQPKTMHLADVMKRTSITDVKGRLIKNLSKGYRQRVGLAQALIGNPPALILDEPTVGLDPKQMIEIRTLIKELAKEHTILLSSHILSEVQAVCPRILVLSSGRLVADGSAEKLRGITGNASLELAVPLDRGDALREVLRHVPGLSAMTTHESSDVLRAQFSFEGGILERSAIFCACAGADIPILELQSLGGSLEDVFLSLTNQKEKDGESA